MNYIQNWRKNMTSLELAAEAEKLLNENPSWPYEKIINKVKEMIKGEKVS